MPHVWPQVYSLPQLPLSSQQNPQPRHWRMDPYPMYPSALALLDPMHSLVIASEFSLGRTEPETYHSYHTYQDSANTTPESSPIRAPIKQGELIALPAADFRPR